MECLDEVDHTLVKAREIMTEGKNNLLSSQLISKEDLSDVVLSLTINTKKSGLQPIFDTKYLHRYYQLKLTHVYMSRNRIISYTRIPLTDLTDAYIIDNIVSDNNILLRSQHQHYFRLISASELNRCLQHDNIFISDLRPIQLPSTQLSCEKVQCKSRLTETVIDEFKPNHFLYKLPANDRIRATIRCENSKKPTPFLLEPRGTLTIRPDCSLSSQLLTIKAVKSTSQALESTAHAIHVTPLPEWQTDIEAQDIIKANLTSVKTLSEENKKIGINIRRSAHAMKTRLNKLEDLSTKAQTGGWALAGIICIIILALIVHKFLC